MPKASKTTSEKQTATRSKAKLSAVNDTELQASILKAAKKCFDRFGVKRTRLEDIAIAAGISRPLLYKIYSNRQKLIETIIAQEVTQIISAQANYLKQCGTFAEAIVEGSLVGIQFSRKAHVLSDLMANSTVMQMPDLVLDKEKPFNAITMKVWKPVFDMGRASGEVSADLSDDDLFEWLMSVHYMFLLRNELDADRIRRLLKLFLSLH
jgi:AcrR family transcriptional regulator